MQPPYRIFYTANEIVYAYTVDDKMYVMDHTIDALVRQLRSR